MRGPRRWMRLVPDRAPGEFLWAEIGRAAALPAAYAVALTEGTNHSNMSASRRASPRASGAASSEAACAASQ